MPRIWEVCESCPCILWALYDFDPGLTYRCQRGEITYEERETFCTQYLPKRCERYMEQVILDQPQAEGLIDGTMP